MKMKKERIILIVTLLLIASLNINLVNAESTFDKNSSFIERNYAEGDYVRGKVNMSFTAQENKNFINNFNGGISLYDLLSNSSLSFSCSPKNCKDTYNAESGATTKNFNALNNKLLGFVVSGGSVNSIESFRFNITDSTGQSSCNNQINVDLFNDGVIDFYNNKNSGEVCGSKGYGCFDKSKSSGNSNVGKTLYCEKINVSAAPGYFIGANVKKESSNSGELTFYIYSNISTEVGTCKSTPDQAVGESKEAGCNVDYPSLKDFQAIVCLQDNKNYAEGEVGYKIKMESDQPCGGTSSAIVKTFHLTNDFEIFAQPLKYASTGTLEFNSEGYKTLNNNKDLKTDIKAYLNKIYGLDCRDNCIVPVNINGSSTSIQIDSGKINYKLTSGISSDSSDIYDLTKKPFEITMNSTFLNVEK